MMKTEKLVWMKISSEESAKWEKRFAKFHVKLFRFFEISHFLFRENFALFVINLKFHEKV